MGILCDAAANGKQELIIESIFSAVPVKVARAKEAMKMAPQVVKVVTQHPSKPQPPKPSSFALISKSNPAFQQPSS